jgi:hypothetical protein
MSDMTADQRSSSEPRAPERGAFVGRLRDLLRDPLGAGRSASPVGPSAQSQCGRPGDSPTCDICHRRLLSGEQLGAYGRGEQLLLACPLCGIELSSAGLQRQPGDPDAQRPPGAAGAKRVA